MAGGGKIIGERGCRNGEGGGGKKGWESGCDKGHGVRGAKGVESIYLNEVFNQTAWTLVY